MLLGALMVNCHHLPPFSEFIFTSGFRKRICTFTRRRESIRKLFKVCIHVGLAAFIAGLLVCIIAILSHEGILFVLGILHLLISIACLMGARKLEDIIFNSMSIEELKSEIEKLFNLATAASSERQRDAFLKKRTRTWKILQNRLYDKG